jgi:hypothetical protein bacD2_18352
MKMKHTDVPVLYIAFARPEYARQSFNAIKAAKPKKFYFYSNKGREGHGDEIERNEQVRSMLKEVDWDCELHTWFREESVDVYTSLWGAINWLFENEEMGIIVEEDCVTSLAYFDFAKKMLLKYQNDQRIWMISGSNYIEGFNPHGHDYIFSHNMIIYGWASWRDRWNKVDWDNINIQEMIDEGVFDAVFDTKQQREFHAKRMLKQQNFVSKTKCWDFIFTTTGRSEGALSIVPKYNLVQNVGIEGVHTKDSGSSIVYNKINYVKDVFEADNEPKYVLADVAWDEKLFQKLHISPNTLFKRICKYLRALI